MARTAAPSAVEARALGDRAEIALRRGDPADAERLYLRALSLVAEADSGEAALERKLRNGLGMAYKARGRFGAARATYEQVLRALAEAGELDGVDAAAVWHNIGGVEHARRNFAAGEVAARRAVEIRSAALGPDHPLAVADRVALAALLQGQRRDDEAEALYVAALEHYERRPDADRLEIAVTSNNLGALLAARGDLAGARRSYRRALEIKRDLLGAGHQDVALTRHNLGMLELQAGKHAVAHEHLAAALAVLRSRLGAEHPRSVACAAALQAAADA